MANIIIIEGLIGSGKTSLGKYLEKLYTTFGKDVKLFVENVDQQLLELYLSNQEKYAFTFQSVVAVQKLDIMKQAVELSKKGTTVIIDRGICGDMAFVEMLKERHCFNDEELLIYFNMLKKYAENNKISIFGHEDIKYKVIFLECLPEVAFQRMLKRGNENEKKKYDITYFEHLNTSYHKLLDKYFGKDVSYIDYNDILDVDKLLHILEIINHE